MPSERERERESVPDFSHGFEELFVDYVIEKESLCFECLLYNI